MGNKPSIELSSEPLFYEIESKFPIDLVKIIYIYANHRPFHDELKSLFMPCTKCPKGIMRLFKYEKLVPFGRMKAEMFLCTVCLYARSKSTKHLVPQIYKIITVLSNLDTFDLSMAKEAIIKTLSERSNIYFIFAVRPNILKDISHPRLICLEVFADPKVIRKFINTCDAYLHAQSLGETWGLSCGEMSMANKPVITWQGGRCQEHLRILGDKCIRYSSADELYKILTTLNPVETRTKDWKAYGEYTPNKVMEIFDRVFLDPLKKKCFG